MCHVLIIEDDPLIAMNIEVLVRELGALTVEIAETQGEAVEAALVTPPALITSDVSLRIGDGPSAIHSIRTALGAVPVIFITASPESCPNPGEWDRVHVKPLDEHEVGRLFRELLAA